MLIFLCISSDASWYVFPFDSMDFTVLCYFLAVTHSFACYLFEVIAMHLDSLDQYADSRHKIL